MEYTHSEKEEHYRDLLNQIIDHVSNCENTSTTIKTLLYWGFTVEDLEQDFNFEETEVKDCSEDMDDFDPIY
jgi:sulfur transfer protein SufE